jgi:hypothetical protein
MIVHFVDTLTRFSRKGMMEPRTVVEAQDVMAKMG